MMILTRMEHCHFNRTPLEGQKFPVWFYELNLELIEWESSMKVLPFDFLMKHLPKGDERWIFSHLTQIRDSQSPSHFNYDLVFTEEEIKELLDNGNFSTLIGAKSLPDKFFLPYFDLFGEQEWKFYLLIRKVTAEQVEKYRLLRFFYPEETHHHPLPLECVPYKHQHFAHIFSHPEMNEEFILAHFEDATNCQHWLLPKFEHFFEGHVIKELADRDGPCMGTVRSCQEKASLEFLERHPRLISSKVFYRKDLPYQFIEKYKEKIKFVLRSKPSTQTLEWLKENRVEAASKWLPLLNSNQTFRGKWDDKIFTLTCRRVVKDLL